MRNRNNEEYKDEEDKIGSLDPQFEPQSLKI
jgi:hypothetical protein